MTNANAKQYKASNQCGVQMCDMESEYNNPLIASIMRQFKAESNKPSRHRKASV